jgi:hypothetical protein
MTDTEEDNKATKELVSAVVGDLCDRIVQQSALESKEILEQKSALNMMEQQDKTDKNKNTLNLISTPNTSTVSGSSSDEQTTNGLNQDSVVSNKSNLTSINNSNTNTGSGKITLNNDDLTKKLNRYKEQDRVQRKEIKELKANRECFL